MSRGTLYRVVRVWIRSLSPIVPREGRAEWVGEWEGELWHAAQGDEARNGALLRRALGALPHALWMRRQEWRRDRVADDLQIAIRAAGRAPGFSAVVILTLALGVGATTAIYSVVDGVLLRPLPYPGAERLVQVSSHFTSLDATLPSVSHASFVEWRRRSRSLEALEGWGVRGAALVGDGDPVVVEEGQVTAGLFPMLGVEPALGRGFVPGENEPGAADVVLLSHSLWRQRYGSDPGVVGRTLRLDDRALEIVGVMPPDFALLPEIDLWTPAPLQPRYNFVVFGGLTTLARLRPGTDLEGAREELTGVATALEREMPESQRGVRPELASYREVLVGDVRRNLLLLMAAVVAVLLVGCVNVANLFLARGATRSGEMAVRATLGASRGRLVRQLLTEGLVLAAVGGVLGVALAGWGVRGLLAILPSEIPLADAVHVDGRVLLFAFATTAGTALLFGLLPAIRSSRTDVRSALGEGRRSTDDRGAQRLGRGLLVVEVAQAVTLLIVAGLLVNTLVHLNRADPGFDPDRLLLVHLTLPGFRYDDATSRTEFRDAVLTRLRRLGGVRSVAAASATPFTENTTLAGLEIEGGRTGTGSTGLGVASPNNPDLLWTALVRATPGYPRTLGLPILAGRLPAPEDGAQAEPVAVVNETMARAFWQEGDAVGRRVRFGGEDGGPWITVIGVVGDLRHPGFTSPGTARMYVPDAGLSAGWPQHVNFVLRTRGDASALIEAARREIWAVDAEVPLPVVAPMTERIVDSLAQARFYALLLGLFASLAVLLAAVGIYGVFSYRVARRTHEMRIRMALGARGEDVRRLVLEEGLATAAAGALLGVAGGAVASRAASGLLYEVEPLDAATYVAAALVAMAAASIAVYIPARRGTPVDPVEALRSE